MTNATCSVNNLTGRDPNGTSSDLPRKFTFSEGTYLDVIKNIRPVPNNTVCRMNVAFEDKKIQSINVKVANMSGASRGTLANGLVMESNGTTCKTDDVSGDCNKAISLPVFPSKISPTFTFDQSPEASELGGIYYPIVNDLDLPAGQIYYVAVHLQNGEQITDRCQAEITPPMSGKAIYQAEAYQVGTDLENTCVIYVSRNVD